MGRKRQDRKLPPDVPTICHRIDWLLREAWANNMTRMAKDLGVSQTALSRVLAGQMPSGKMLEGLAGRADINTRWLLAGQGAEMLGAGRSPGSVLCPLATTLLRGDPVNSPELLARLTLPVACPHLLEAAYWLTVEAGSPILSDPSEKVAEGDYLLIETAPRWTSRPEAYLGRVVVLWAEGRPPLLARVNRDEDYFAGDGRHELNTFGLFPDAALLSKPMREAAKSRRGASGGPELFYADHIVGVVLQVARIM